MRKLLQEVTHALPNKQQCRARQANYTHIAITGKTN